MNYMTFASNAMAEFFAKIRGKDNNNVVANSQAISQTEVNTIETPSNSYLGTGATGGYYNVGIQFEEYLQSKAQRISKYRGMAMYPEIKNAIEVICDDAIVEDPEGDIVKLDIEAEYPEHIKEKLHDYWDYLINDIFNFKETGWDLFKKFMVEGELYFELILSEDGKQLIGIKLLPAVTMSPIYKNGQILSYVQTFSKVETEDGEEKIISEKKLFDKDQIIFIQFDPSGMGFLEASTKTYNMLTQMEDSVVIYRMTRAAEKRVWNIYTGELPKGKAEEYVRNIIFKYRRNVQFDANSGMIIGNNHVQSMTEDYWFPKPKDSDGTTVGTIKGELNLGDMDDIKYMLDKLYTSLGVPNTRRPTGAETTFNPGKMGEIQREEIKFARNIERWQRVFKYILMNAYITLLKINKMNEMYVDSHAFNIQFTKSNLFKEYKELDIWSSKAQLLSSLNAYIVTKETLNAPFAMETVLKDILMLPDSFYEKNKELAEKERAKIKEEEAAEMGGNEGAGGEDMGGGVDLGGGDMGDFGGSEMGTEEQMATPELPTEQPNLPPEIPAAESVSAVEYIDSLLLG